MKVYFYNIHMYYKGSKIDEDLKEFFKRILTVRKEDRIRRTFKNYPILIESKREIPGKLGVSFYKYREDYKPFIEDENGNIEQIEKDVIEITNCILDYNYNIIAIQYHFEGVKESGITSYLNSFIENKEFEIKIEKIYENFDLNYILNSDRITSIEPLVKNNSISNGFTASELMSSVSSLLSSNEEISPKVNFVIKNTKRNGSFSGSSLRAFIDALESETLDCDVESIIVEYVRNGKLERTDIQNLRKQLYVEILKGEKNPSIEYIYVTLETEYQEYLKIAIRLSDEFSKNLSRPNEVYILKEIPDERYKVNR